MTVQGLKLATGTGILSAPVASIEGPWQGYDGEDMFPGNRSRWQRRSRRQSRRWRVAFERHYGRYLVRELTLQRQRRQPLREVVGPTLSDIDAEAASQAGLHGIWLDRNGAVEGHDSKFPINSLVALPLLIERLARIH